MKKVLIAILFVFLFLPIIQKNVEWVEERPLQGWFVPAEDTVYTWKGWISGKYQLKKEKYLNENFGFRTTLSRFYNEYRYRFFRQTTNVDVTFGKNDVFLSKAYVESYVGQDYIGHERILKMAKGLKVLHDSLRKLNITLIPILAPNKLRLQKECTPDSYLPVKMSNYEDIVQTFTDLKIPFLDYNNYFEKTANTTPYPYFSQYAQHWSPYAQAVATDTLIKYIEKKRNIKMPAFHWKENIETSDELRGVDYEMGGSINLLTKQLPSVKMAYPKISYSEKDRTKPSLLVIGDSFFFGMQEMGVPNELFSNVKFVYYFKQMYIPKDESPDAMARFDIEKEIKSHDVVIILCAEHNLDTFGWDFIERANALLARSEEIKAAEAIVGTDAAWMKSNEDKARQNGVTIKEVMVQAAQWLVDSKKEKK